MVPCRVYGSFARNIARVVNDYSNGTILLARFKSEGAASAAESRAKDMMTIDDLFLVRDNIRHLDRADLHCRYCRAGTWNHWQHSESCSYQESVAGSKNARELVNAEIDSLLNASRPSC